MSGNSRPSADGSDRQLPGILSAIDVAQQASATWSSSARATFLISVNFMVGIGPFGAGWQLHWQKNAISQDPIAYPLEPERPCRYRVGPAWAALCSTVQTSTRSVVKLRQLHAKVNMQERISHLRYKGAAVTIRCVELTSQSQPAALSQPTRLLTGSLT